MDREGGRKQGRRRFIGNTWWRKRRVVGGYKSYRSRSSSPYTIRVAADYVDARSLSTLHRSDHMRSPLSQAWIRVGEREGYSGMMYDWRERGNEGKGKWPWPVTAFWKLVFTNNFVVIVPAQGLLRTGFGLRKSDGMCLEDGVKCGFMWEIEAGLKQSARSIAPSARRNGWHVSLRSCGWYEVRGLYPWKGHWRMAAGGQRSRGSCSGFEREFGGGAPGERV